MSDSLQNSARSQRPDIDYFGLHLRQVPAFRALLRGVECRLLAEVDMSRPVLDIGCGDGSFAEILADKEWLVGIDVWAAGVREAAARKSYREVLVSSGTRLPFAEGAFNTVVSNCVLEHIPDVDAVVGEASRVLRAGGRLVITVPSHMFSSMLFGTTLFRRLGLARFAQAYGDWFNRHSAHYHCDTPERWIERLEGAGFQVEHWQYYMSPAAVWAIDRAHYYGIPSLLMRKLTGRWVLGSAHWNFALPERWLRKYYEEPEPEQGGYIFMVAIKADGPLMPDGPHEGAVRDDRVS